MNLPALDEFLVCALASRHHGRRRTGDTALDHHPEAPVSKVSVLKTQLDENRLGGRRPERIGGVGHSGSRREGVVLELLDPEAELAHARLREEDPAHDGQVGQVQLRHSFVAALQGDDAVDVGGVVREAEVDGVGEDDGVVGEADGGAAVVEERFAGEVVFSRVHAAAGVRQRHGLLDKDQVKGHARASFDYGWLSLPQFFS